MNRTKISIPKIMIFLMALFSGVAIVFAQSAGFVPYGFFKKINSVVNLWGNPITSMGRVCLSGGVVYDIEKMSDTRYILGGTFSKASQCTGSGIPLDPSSGQIVSDFNYANAAVGGSVTSSVSDNTGGWYIAGRIKGVGGVFRNNVAHVNSDGSLDVTFLADTYFNGPINTVAYDASLGRLYVGGNFSGSNIKYGVTINESTSEVNVPISTYMSGPFDDSVLVAIHDGAGGWYIGGLFTEYRGENVERIAHILSDGTIDPYFKPQVDGDIWDMYLDGTTLWIAGKFDHVAGVHRTLVAAISTVTGIVQGNNPAINGEAVYSITKLGSDMIIGGDFDKVNIEAFSQSTVINKSTGLIVPGSPIISGGEVMAIVSDGAGGWYIGGDFTSVNNQSRTRIARINSDGTLNSWYPTDGASNTITSMYYDNANSKLYVGGGFYGIGGQSRTMIAQINTVTAAVTSWYPTGGANGVIRAITMDSANNVYISGDFTNVGGVARNRIAMIDPAGAVSTTWYPAGGADNRIYAMTIDSSGNIYVGGEFLNIGGVARNRIAMIDSTGAVSTAWYPAGGADNRVNAIALDAANNLYVGGRFNNIGGLARIAIARIDSTGAVSATWYPTNGAGDMVNALALNSNTNSVYIAGDFTTAGGQSRNYVAEIDSSAAVTAWFPSGVNNYATAIYVNSNEDIVIGGEFTTVGGHIRKSIAAITTGGTLTSWYPPGGVNSGIVNAIAANGSSNVYIGGDFSNVGGQTRNRIASINSSGAVTSWYPTNGANSRVNAVAIDGSGTVYIGGDFTYAGGQARNRIAAFNSSGTLLSWYPTGGANSEIFRIVPDSNGLVYVGGGFSTIGGQSRSRIAALDSSANVTSLRMYGLNIHVHAISRNNAGSIFVGGDFTGLSQSNIKSYIAALNSTTGALLNWSITGGAPDGNIRKIEIGSGSNIYIGGEFSNVGGQARNRIAAIDSSGVVTSWYPTGGANNNVSNIAIDSSSNVYVVGQFSSIGGQARSGIAKIDSTAAITSWYPTGGITGSDTTAIALDSSSNVYIGGNFTTVGGLARKNIAQIDSTAAVTSWYPATGADGPVNSILLDSPTASTIYVGGSFANIGGQTRSNIAAIDNLGNVTTWYPTNGINGSVSSLSMNTTGRIYTGGSFISVGGITRNRLAAIDNNGYLTTWYPTNGANNSVFALSSNAAKTLVYIGGDFTSTGGKSRNRIAAGDSTGTITSWYPSGGADGHVHDFVVTSTGSVYVGGDFEYIGGQTRYGLAELSSAAAVTSWYPGGVHNVYSMAFDSVNSILYIGGLFSSVGATARNNLAAINTSTQAVTSFDVNVSSSIYTVELDNSKLYFGGYFEQVNGTNRSRLAAVDTSAALLDWPNGGGVYNSSSDPSISTIKKDSTNNKVYVGGSFQWMSGTTRGGVGAIEASGMTSTWDLNTQSSAVVEVVKYDSVSDRILLGGSYNYVNLWPRQGIVILNPSGVPQ